MKFIGINSIDKNARPKTRDTIEEMSIYPEFKELLIFSKGIKNTVNVEDGVLFYDNNTLQPIPFVIVDKYKLVDCRQEHVYGTARKTVYIFSFHDYSFQTTREIKSQEADTIVNKRAFIEALDNTIKEIVFASQFNSWIEYQECRLLRIENEKLKKEIEELKKIK